MEYQTRFPEVFEFIASSNNSSNDMFHETDVFRGPDGPERAKDLVVWLENLPCHTAPRQPFGTETLEEAAIKKIEESADALKGCERKMIVMQVNPRLLYLPNQLVPLWSSLGLPSACTTELSTLKGLWRTPRNP